MDENLYSKPIINRFINKHLFFDDPKLKKYYTNNNLKKFRDKVAEKHNDKSFEKLMYVLVTDNIRDIIIQTIGELTELTKDMGSLIISGGEAFNMYMPFKERLVTSDIDAKFVPHMEMNEKYFGKLQGVKLILWDKLGQIAKKLERKIKNRLQSRRVQKIFKFVGMGFKNKGPYVTRRYTLIKKKKTRNDNKPGKQDIFIDVELFALDLNIRYFSPENGRIISHTLGGILDIPFMRPKEFGYEVASDKRMGVTYRKLNSNQMVNDNRVFVASKEFLIRDIYLMHKLNLRPEKKEKDRQRLIKLSKLFTKTIKNDDSIETVMKKVRRRLGATPITPKRHSNKNVDMSKALRVNPRKYEKYTTVPSAEKLSRQIVHGLNPVVKNTNVDGFSRTNGNMFFNTDSLKWKPVTNNAYVKNEYMFRPNTARPLPTNFKLEETLYGFRKDRNAWVPKPLLNKAAMIPFIGLKNKYDHSV